MVERRDLRRKGPALTQAEAEKLADELLAIAAAKGVAMRGDRPKPDSPDISDLLRADLVQRLRRL